MDRIVTPHVIPLLIDRVFINAYNVGDANDADCSDEKTFEIMLDTKMVGEDDDDIVQTPLVTYVESNPDYYYDNSVCEMTYTIIDSF